MAYVSVIFDFDNDPQLDKSTFLEKHHIGLVRGFVYTRNETGEIDGVVFLGYKSRIDKHLKKGIKSWNTARPISTKNLKEDMWVYIGETDYDLDTRKQTINPKIRVKGRLKKVYRVLGKEKKKCFHNV